MVSRRFQITNIIVLKPERKSYLQISKEIISQREPQTIWKVVIFLDCNWLQRKRWELLERISLLQWQMHQNEKMQTTWRLSQELCLQFCHRKLCQNLNLTFTEMFYNYSKINIYAHTVVADNFYADAFLRSKMLDFWGRFWGLLIIFPECPEFTKNLPRIYSKFTLNLPRI